MCADSFTSRSPLLPDDGLGTLAQAFLNAESGSRERLSECLTIRAAATARDFLGASVAETDDIVQDSVVSVLAWLERQDKFSGSLDSFTIAVTRNRCRNFLTWRRRQRTVPLAETTRYLPAEALSPLEAMLAAERISLLQAAVDDLDHDCRNLLHEIYFNGRQMADLQRESGLGTLQAMYKRRANCLEKVEIFLNRRLDGCSSHRDVK